MLSTVSCFGSSSDSCARRLAPLSHHILESCLYDFLRERSLAGILVLSNIRAVGRLSWPLRCGYYFADRPWARFLLPDSGRGRCPPAGSRGAGLLNNGRRSQWTSCAMLPHMDPTRPVGLLSSAERWKIATHHYYPLPLPHSPIRPTSTHPSPDCTVILKTCLICLALKTQNQGCRLGRRLSEDFLCLSSEETLDCAHRVAIGMYVSSSSQQSFARMRSIDRRFPAHGHCRVNEARPW
jgi:hypothetical protein